jgi:hypothetical protein
MKTTKILTDTVEDPSISPTSSDSEGDCVLEKPKLIVKNKTPYVMTDARKKNMENMRLARNVKVEKRKQIKQIDEDKKTAERYLATKMQEKKTKKTMKQTKAIKIIQAELSDSNSESEIEEVVVKKHMKKTLKRTKKIVKHCESDSESEDEPAVKNVSNKVNYVFV